jgi:hypothetical protein
MLHFWLPPKCEEIDDSIDNSTVTVKLLDICINFIVSGGAKIIQRTINCLPEYWKGYPVLKCQIFCTRITRHSGFTRMFDV